MRRFAAFGTTFLLLLSGLSSPGSLKADADTVFVGSAVSDAGGSCADPDYSTVESSMDVALATAIGEVDAGGDVIVICNGTYRYADSMEWITQMNDFGIVAEVNGKVTLDGGGAYGLLAVAGEGSLLTIEGIRFVRAGDTGAIYRPDGDLVLHESEFVGNNKLDESGEAGFGGGAINGDPDCDDTFEIHDSVFRSNTGPTGAVSTCTVIVDHSTFVSNSSSGDGGALFICTLQMASSTLLRNRATEGGAVNACSMDIADNRFERNVSTSVGGAVWVSELSNPDGWLQNDFIGNRSRRGGAIFVGCRPTNSRSIETKLRRSNRFSVNSVGNVWFDHGSCGPG